MLMTRHAHKPRRAYEAGHRPKFLALVDDSVECDRALRFAARRARRVGADLVLLAVIAPDPEAPDLLGVADLIRDEAAAQAHTRLATVAAATGALAGAAPTLLIREGDRAAALLDVIDNDEDVSLLVLAASPRGQGPGLLIDSLLASDATPFPVPIAIVPAGLSDAQIDAVA